MSCLQQDATVLIDSIIRICENLIYGLESLLITRYSLLKRVRLMGGHGKSIASNRLLKVEA